jgi:hypothetical protein
MVPVRLLSSGVSTLLGLASWLREKAQRETAALRPLVVQEDAVGAATSALGLMVIRVVGYSVDRESDKRREGRESRFM